MDDKWFKRQQKKADVTAEEIAEKLGRDRSVVSRIYVGRQKMTLEQAKVFADVLNVPLHEVLERAGVAAASEARTIMPGFSEGDAHPFHAKDGDEDKLSSIARGFGGGRAGIDVWQARSRAMAMFGIIPGDMMLVDTSAPESCKKGDTVVAQVYDWQTGSADTVLRRYEPPVLMGFSPGGADPCIHVVDWQNVVIRGKVIASWRSNA